MVVENLHEIGSFKQGKWLEKYISFNTRKTKELKKILRKISINYLKAAFGKMMESVRNRLKIKFS